MDVPILCYHKVSSEQAEKRWLNVHPKRLSQHLRFFARRGYRFTRVCDLAGQWPTDAVCFTFDDAYLSALTYGVEALASFQAVATFYAVSNCVGGTSIWDGERAGQLADWDLLQAAASQGHEIGNHTGTHPHLGSLNEAEQVLEIDSCKEALARQGFASGSFCYPYGDYSPVSADALRACGYQVAVAIGKRPAKPTDSRLALPRIVMSYGDSPAMLIYKLYVRPKLKGQGTKTHV